MPTAMLPGPGLLSMTAGDFVEVYATPAQAGAFDCVATCFFLACRPSTHVFFNSLQIYATSTSLYGGCAV